MSQQTAIAMQTTHSLNLERDVVLAPFTTFGIGGPADLFTMTHSAEELVEALRFARRERLPSFVLGTGANILVGDLGFRGLVICNRASHVRFEDSQLEAESGATIAELIKLTTDRGLSGLEHYINIPSTVGGAMWQNLHFLSPDRTRTVFIEECVNSARLLTGDDQIQVVDRDYFRFGYDHSILHTNDDVVLAVTFDLMRSDPGRMREIAEKNAAWRAANHPPGAERQSAGSIFQRIENVGAGRLIDAAGLKGMRIGGAEISPRHANYIINVDSASARDVCELIAYTRDRVRADSGYELEPEIGFVGQFSEPTPPTGGG